MEHIPCTTYLKYIDIKDILDDEKIEMNTLSLAFAASQDVPSYLNN